MTGFTDMSEVENLRWLSTEQARKILGVSARTLYRFVDEDLLPAYRMGRVIRFQQAEVMAFIVRQRIEPGSIAHLYPEPVKDDEGGGS